MNRGIKRWNLLGIIFTIAVGSLLHFIYEWSGNNPIVGIFGAVNESIWEHLKMIFWSVLLFSIVEFVFIGKHYKNYIIGRAVTIYIGLLTVIILYYTYTGVIGQHYMAVDISIFVLSVILGYYVGHRIIDSKNRVNALINILGAIGILLLITAFVIYTGNPPQLPLFLEP